MVPDAFRMGAERPHDALIRALTGPTFAESARCSQRAPAARKRHVPWRPEDWKEWPVKSWVTDYCEASHVRAVRDILRGLPGRERKCVADLTRGPSTDLSFLTACFERAITVDLRDHAIEHLALPPNLDVIVAVDSVRAKGADDLLVSIHDALVEGGVFLATLTARARGPRPFPMRGAEPRSGFHEVELQYRLRRAGFQGLRMRRFRQEIHEPDTILCMAVRRALN
jgi:hypothetical protein